MDYKYKTHGTCSQYIYFSIEDGLVHNVRYLGGCDGNLQAIGKLVEGQPVQDVIEKLSGISCGGKPTSCGDQLAQALKAALKETK